MTAMTGEECVNLGCLDPDYLRRMGENEASIRFLRAGMDDDGRSGGVAVELEQVAERSLLDVLGEALDPRGLTMDRVVAHMATIPYTAPATETGD